MPTPYETLQHSRKDWGIGARTAKYRRAVKPKSMKAEQILGENRTIPTAIRAILAQRSLCVHPI